MSKTIGQNLHKVTDVIVVIPIAIGVPLVVVLVPPAMIRGIAAFPLLMQFVSPVFGLAGGRFAALRLAL